jgi:catechol 2,3-dioxygenase-like lactoylglutathione lyase family enzyme
MPDGVRRRIDDLIRGYDDGGLDRDDLVEQLAALAGATDDPPPRPSTFRVIGLNHGALRVTDIPRSRDFYVEHLGARVIRESETNCFLALGANHFLGLFRRDSGGLDHLCFTIDDYDPDRAEETLRAAGFTPHRNQDRVFFPDPDGNLVQLASTWGDYPR